MPESLPARAVQPARHHPDVPRPWQSLGLPETGLVVLVDVPLCRECGAGDPPPCAHGCAAAHHLPGPVRLTGTFMPPVCPQCIAAPCVESCPVDAIAHTAEGIVVVDQELCIGCRFCEDACPAEGVMYVDPHQVEIPAETLADYRASRPDGRLPNTVTKCTFCADKIAGGEMPVCAEYCPSGAIYVGNLDLNTVTNGRSVGRLDALLQGRPFALREMQAGVGARLIHLN